MAVFFTIVIVGIQSTFPGAMTESLSSIGAAKLRLCRIPPTGALFSAFLGYNPMDAILGASRLRA